MISPATLNLGPYRYKPQQHLDETRMSTLWIASEAEADGNLRLVTVKVARMSETQYSLANQRAIENEERWLSRLRHRNIVRLRAIAEQEHGGRTVYRARSLLPGEPWFLVTDYLPGGDLNKLLAERGKLPASLALQIAQHLADALHFIHEQGCVHCDIKSRNVLFQRKPEGFRLSADTEPILIDFGIAKDPNQGAQRVTGTPVWMPPEAHIALRSGDRLVPDRSWDVYALNLLLYNMLSGRRAVLGEPSSSAWDRFGAPDFENDSTVIDATRMADGLNELLSRASADDPAERLSAAQFSAEVRRLRGLIQIPEPVEKKRRRLPLGWVFAGLLALIVAALGFALRGGNGATTTPPATAATVLAPVVMASTPTPKPTSTPSHTATATTQPSATTRPTSTLRPTPTLAGTVDDVGNSLVPTATDRPTSTRAPTSTRFADATSTRLPTVTPLPTTRPTIVPTATRPPSVAVVPVTGQTVTLLAPPDGMTALGRVNFVWQPNFTPQRNDCFEVRLWPGDRDNWANGFGVSAHGKETSIAPRFDEKLEESLTGLNTGTNYYWGVLLVECSPYRVRGLISEARSIIYERP